MAANWGNGGWGRVQLFTMKKLFANRIKSFYFSTSSTFSVKLIYWIPMALDWTQNWVESDILEMRCRRNRQVWIGLSRLQVWIGLSRLHAFHISFTVYDWFWSYWEHILKLDKARKMQKKGSNLTTICCTAMFLNNFDVSAFQ